LIPEIKEAAARQSGCHDAGRPKTDLASMSSFAWG
jgi:hypothetical protein